MKAEANGDYKMRNNVIKLTDLLAEGNLTPFMSKPSTPASKLPPIVLTLDRKVDAYTGFFRLETDKWFRRYLEPAKGHGVQIRKMKVTAGPKSAGWGGKDIERYSVVVTYLPNLIPDYIGYDDPKNYEKTKGFLDISGDAIGKVTGKDIERFVNANVRKYIA